jgi:hypothetical protein
VNALGTALACFSCTDSADFIFQGDNMQFQDDTDQRSHSTRHSQIDTPPVSAKFVMRRRGTRVPRPIQKAQRADSQLHDAGIVDESPMVTMCYEAHLSMQKMLAVFAELRGDDAADIIG